MTIEQAKLELTKIGIHENEYSLGEGLKNNALVIDNFGGTWKIFYYEKGEDRLIGLFTSESKALRFLINSFKKTGSL